MAAIYNLKNLPWKIKHVEDDATYFIDTDLEQSKCC